MSKAAGITSSSTGVPSELLEQDHCGECHVPTHFHVLEGYGPGNWTMGHSMRAEHGDPEVPLLSPPRQVVQKLLP